MSKMAATKERSMARKKRKRGDRTGAACHFCAGKHTSSDCPTLDEDGEEEPRQKRRKWKRGDGPCRGQYWRSFEAART